MTRYGAAEIPLALSLALVLTTASPGSDSPQGGHKVELQYIAYPETTFVDSERRMDVCLVNHGQNAELVYDGAKDLDQVVVSVPVGSLDDDLTEEPMVLYCVPSEPDWLCLGPELQGDDVLLTFRPDGRAQVLAGETLCFQVVTLNVNPEVGLAFLGVDQQIDSKRALSPVNDWMTVFKTDLPVLRHDDLAEVRPDQHHARYTDQEAFQAVLDRGGHGSGLDADTVDGHEGDALEESQEIDDDIAAHAALPEVHHARYTDPEAFLAVLARDGHGSGLDADTVDGHEGDALEESQEIDDDITAHAAIEDAHHSRYTDPEAFQALLDRDGSTSGLDADTLDGHHGVELEESQEIDGDLAVHAAIEGAHHARYTDLEARDAAGPHFSGSHEDLADVLPSQHHPRYTNAEAFQAVLARDGSGSGLDADTLHGKAVADFVQTSGDTMEGDLYLPDDGLGGDLRAATKGSIAKNTRRLTDFFTSIIELGTCIPESIRPAETIVFDALLEAELAQKFAPVLRYHEDSCNNAFPMSPQAYYDALIQNDSYLKGEHVPFDNSDVDTLGNPGWLYDLPVRRCDSGPCAGRLCQNDDDCLHYIPDIGNCYSSSTGSGSCVQEGTLPSYVPTFYRVFRCGDQARIMYWWYYGYQNYCWGREGFHHGDWERVMVILDLKQTVPAAVVYWQHGGWYTRFCNRQGFAVTDSRWGSREACTTKSSGFTHPLVYVGEVQHGSYYNEAGKYTGTFADCYYFNDRRGNSYALESGKHLMRLDRIGFDDDLDGLTDEDGPDDDGDTQVDEDPIDGKDNDGDTRVDEDPPCQPGSHAKQEACAAVADNDADTLVDEDGYQEWMEADWGGAFIWGYDGVSTHPTRELSGCCKNVCQGQLSTDMYALTCGDCVDQAGASGCQATQCPLNGDRHTHTQTWWCGDGCGMIYINETQWCYTPDLARSCYRAHTVRIPTADEYLWCCPKDDPNCGETKCSPSP